MALGHIGGSCPCCCDEPPMKTLDQCVVRVELIDPHPAFELLEAHQIEHEGRPHDPRGIPGQFVQCLAQETLGRQHAVAHVAERIRIRLAEVVEVLRQIRRLLADGLQRDDREIVPTAFLSEEAEILFAIG